jgi:hypothetical protein
MSIQVSAHEAVNPNEVLIERATKSVIAPPPETPPDYLAYYQAGTFSGSFTRSGNFGGAGSRVGVMGSLSGTTMWRRTGSPICIVFSCHYSAA